MGAAQDGLDAGDQLARIEGLGDIVIGAQLQADDLVHIVVAGGEHDDGQVGRESARAHLTADRPPVDLGKHEVEDHQSRELAGNQFERLGTGAGGLRAVALPLQVHTHQFDDVGFIIDDEDGSTRSFWQPPSTKWS